MAEMSSELHTDQNVRAAAHGKALLHIDFIQKHVIQNNEVVQLSYLRPLYIEKLNENGFPYPEYRSEKSKNTLQKHEIGELIGFTTVNTGNKGFISYDLIHNASITVTDAVRYAYELGSKDKYEEVALLLRQIIQHAFKESESSPWPPTADDLDIVPSLPSELIKFLNFVISGEEDTEGSEKVHRIILSIGQDICRAVTHGEWKLPKHILFAATIRHLYRSKKLVTIINRLGHCESYDFCLELDTAMAKDLEEVSTLLTPQIVTGENNEVFHMEWDNMNKITTNIHGNNIVNSTGGIMVQEVKSGVVPSSTDRTLPVYERSKSRTLKSCVPEKIALFHLHKRVEPNFPENATYTHPEINTLIYSECINELNI